MFYYGIIKFGFFFNKYTKTWKILFLNLIFILIVTSWTDEHLYRCIYGCLFVTIHVHNYFGHLNITKDWVLIQLFNNKYNKINTSVYYLCYSYIIYCHN